MSLQAMVWVLEEAPDVKPHLVSTLLGLANHADRDGQGAYPYQSTLAWYARKSERQIRKDLAELQLGGLLREGDQRLAGHIPIDRRPIVYDLALERQRGAKPESGRNSSSSRDRNHSSSRNEETTGTTVPPAIHPGGTTVPAAAGTTRPDRPELQGQSGRNHSSYITVLEPTTKPEPQPSLLRMRTNGAAPSSAAATTTPTNGRTKLPDDWRITDAMRRWAHATFPGIDVDHETAQFCSWHRGEGTTKESWPDVWQKWIRDSGKRAARAPRAITSRPNPQNETDAMFERALERAQAREAAGQ